MTYTADHPGTYRGPALRIPGAGGERVGRPIPAGAEGNHLVRMPLQHHRRGVRRWSPLVVMYLQYI